MNTVRIVIIIPITIFNAPDSLVCKQFAGDVPILSVMHLNVDTAALSHLISLSVQSKHGTAVISSQAAGGDQEEGRLCWRLLSGWWRK